MERRTARRFEMRLPVVVRAEAAETGVEVVSETRDVSSRGLYFTVDRDLPIGSPVEVVLTLPGEITMMGSVQIRCQDRIVRTDEKEMPQRKLGVAAVIDRYEFVRPEESAE